MEEQIDNYSDKEIAEIMNGEECQYNFKCLKGGLENIKFDRPFEGWHIFKCQFEEPQACPYSEPRGYCHICKCPLLQHIDICRELEL